MAGGVGNAAGGSDDAIVRVMQIAADPKLRRHLMHEALAIVDPVAGQRIAAVLRRQRGRDRRPVGDHHYQEARLREQVFGLEPMGFQMTLNRPGCRIARPCLEIGNDLADPAEVAGIAPSEKVRIPGRSPEPCSVDLDRVARQIVQAAEVSGQRFP